MKFGLPEAVLGARKSYVCCFITVKIVWSSHVKVFTANVSSTPKNFSEFYYAIPTSELAALPCSYVFSVVWSSVRMAQKTIDDKLLHNASANLT